MMEAVTVRPCDSMSYCGAAALRKEQMTLIAAATRSGPDPGPRRSTPEEETGNDAVVASTPDSVGNSNHKDGESHAKSPPPPSTASSLRYPPPGSLTGAQALANLQPLLRNDDKVLPTTLDPTLLARDEHHSAFYLPTNRTANAVEADSYASLPERTTSEEEQQHHSRHPENLACDAAAFAEKQAREARLAAIIAKEEARRAQIAAVQQRFALANGRYALPVRLVWVITALLWCIHSIAAWLYWLWTVLAPVFIPGSRG